MFFLFQDMKNQPFLYESSAKLMPLRSCLGFPCYPCAFLTMEYYSFKSFFFPFAEMLQSMFPVSSPMQREMCRLLHGILLPADFAHLMKQAHWDPLKNIVAKERWLSTTSHNYQRTKDARNPPRCVASGNTEIFLVKVSRGKM